VNRDAARKIDHHQRVPEQSGAERRQHERFELLVQVTVLDHTKTGTFTVLNISAGGVLLRNDQNLPFEVGEAIRVQFNAPQLTKAFAIEAKIIRVVAPASKTSALAAMWTSMDPTATAGLSDVLWGLSKAP
jgi:c-di-GMP-binding flagellar brake protein YcgR